MVFQQDGKIEIIVRKQDEGSTPDTIGNGEIPTEEVGGDNNKSWWNGLSANKKKRIIKTNATQIFATSKQIGLLALSHYQSFLGSKHGDAHYQDTAQRTWEMIDDTSSLVSSVAMGATYGSWGGPIGTVVGILTNFASTAASIGFKYEGRERDLSIKQFKENNGIQYQRARAGINLTTGRLR